MRTFDVLNKDGKPKAVRHYGEWSKTDEGDKRLLGKINQGFISASDALAHSLPQEARLIQDQGPLAGLTHLLRALYGSTSSIVSIPGSSGPS
ncbi:hypothetical protein EKO04_000426 [Ascochyta lentis]|uniref:Uncharacterized protein n=1 Tax=Ascochyta lentis TaxID=205686 RepID=A0A8H7JEN3_9PLEO|nr:hypothetical protein EKO04_000426 [Ascochyta lentis]